MQRSFARGEIGPTLYGGADPNVYNQALATCQNFEILRHGGAANRPGFRWCAEVKDSTTRTWLLKFEFSDTDTYIIEAGQHYFRFFQQGGQVVVSPSAWSNLTTYVPGNLVSHSGVNYYCILGNTNFAPPNATYWYPLTGDILEIPTPYAAADIPLLKYVQAGDIVTLTHSEYPPAELQRTAQGWVLVTISTAPAIAPPAGLTVAVGGMTITFNTNPANNDHINIAGEPYTFKSSLTGATFEVHIGASASATANNLFEAITAGAGAGSDYGTGTTANTNATASVSGNVVSLTALTSAGITLSFILGTAWTFGPQQASYQVTAFLPTTFEESIGCTPVTEPSNVPTTSTPNVLSWSAVSGALGYNVYLDNTGNGLYGFIGTTPNLSFNDIGYVPDASVTPPLANVLFNSTTNYPSCASFYQQRRLFGNTDTEPEGVWCSRTGAFYNFTYSSPIQDDDAVIFGIASRKVSTVRHLIDIGTLMALTATGEHAIFGDTDGTLKPTAINDRQQTYFGASDVIPCLIGKTIIYLQARGTIIRDLKLDTSTNVLSYNGRDLTIFSPHLFEGRSIERMDFAQTPESIVWAVRDDGRLLGLTYIPEFDVFGWHQHVTTNGVFEDVCTIPESTAPATPWATYQNIQEDAVYCIINRTINGVTRRYVERLCSRVFSDYRLDAYFLDSMLTYNGINVGSTTMTITGTYTQGGAVTVTASAPTFSAGWVGDGVTVWIPAVLDLLGNIVTPGVTVRVTITGYTSTTQVSGTLSAALPVGLQNTPTLSWSHAVQGVSGLTYLEGQSVGICANGVPLTGVVDNTGAVSLGGGLYDVVHVGLPITATLQTLDLDSGQQEVRDKQKLVNDISVVVEQSRGFYSGPDFAHLLPFPLPAGSMLGTDVFSSNGGAVLTQTLEGNILAGWNMSGRVVIQQRDPLPLAVLGIIRNGPLGG